MALGVDDALLHVFAERYITLHGNAHREELLDQAARKQLLVVFEAAGFHSEVAKQGRRLSSILFS